MTMDILSLGNLGYFLMLIALAISDILWLRIVLISAHVSLVAYGVIEDYKTIAFWYSVFLIINTIQVIRVLRERKPIHIPADLSDIYKGVFPMMKQREFLYFWHMGTVKEVSDDFIIRKGEHQKELSLVFSGNAGVLSNGVEIARLSRGKFIAEMSFLTAEPASADVLAKERVQYISWEQKKLRDLEQLNPQLLIKIQKVLGKDLTDKIKAISTRQ